MDKKIVYSIGYTAFKIDNFMYTLNKYKINCIIDARSNPMSKFYKDYNKDTIKDTLNKNNILYRNYGKEFGARQNNRKYHTNGQLDFNKFLLSDEFNSGIKKVIKGIDIGYTFCIMCAEKEPITCHRSIMIARGFKNYGIDIRHIIKNGNFITQNDIEKELLEYYFKDKEQINIFFGTKTDDELIKEAYDLRNKEIGFIGE